MVDSSNCFESPEVRLKSLSDIGSKVSLNTSLQIRLYFNSGNEMQRMARVFLKERNYERAYVIYMRYITLFVEKLREHPQYKDADPSQKSRVRDSCKEIFPILEDLKSKLKAKYEDEYKIYLQKREQERKEAESVHQEGKKQEFIKSLEDRLAEKIQFKLSELEDNQISKDTDKLNPKSQAGPSSATATPATTPVDRNSQFILPEPIDNQPSAPSFDRSTKPSGFYSLFGGTEGLRRILVPVGLTLKFLELAKPNTGRNIETCGILAGRLSLNDFIITHVLIPPQRGTSDSCLTENEEKLFLYQDKHDLITLGWIHTHPSQSSFMSSIDLHTHCSYQLMLPEAIAIVCAPKFGEIGVYSLTNDYGVDFIAQCKTTGFHPHPTSPPIYEESKHVIFEDKAPLEIIDLR